MKTMETERLILRPFAPEDMEEIHRLIYSDPDVAIPFAGKTRSFEATAAALSHPDPHAEFGGLSILRKETAEIIGRICLDPYLAWFMRFGDDPDTPYNRIEVELSYALGRQHWGQGYATEACRAVLAYAFTDLRLRRIVNSIDSRNSRSLELMKRLGFRIEQNRHPRWPGVIGIRENDML